MKLAVLGILAAGMVLAMRGLPRQRKGKEGVTSGGENGGGLILTVRSVLQTPEEVEA